MAAGRSIAKPLLGYAGRRGGGNMVRFNHRMVIGAAGAISSQDAFQDSGVKDVSKTAATTGRYTITLPYKAKQFRGGDVTIIGPDTAAYGAVSVGLHGIFRADTLSVDGTVKVQFLNASTNFTDAELPSGTVVVLDFAVKI